MAATKLHVVMYPWFAMGHIIPFLKLSNKLAEKGHIVSFLLPAKTLQKLNHLNLHPHLIELIPLSVPHVEGLPHGAETTLEVSGNKIPRLFHAADLTQGQVEVVLQKTKPDLIFFDFAYWIPSLVQPLGIKSIFFGTMSALRAVKLVPRLLKEREQWCEHELIEPPEIYPGSSSAKPAFYEIKNTNDVLCYSTCNKISNLHRVLTSMSSCEALCYNTCSELEGPFVDYIGKQYNKKVLLTGPLLGEPSHDPLEERWATWLEGLEKGSVVYCALGSECVLERDQFQELVLGLELTGSPFLARLNPPTGAKTVEEALPEGFEERVKGRGVVHGGWVHQQHILSHPSVGCFVSHAGSGSMWDSLVSSCQIVLIPQMLDQFTNTKFMSRGIKVAVAVERREEDGWFTRENVCKAVKLVRDEGSEIGGVVRVNHHKWKDILLAEGLESSYINNFIMDLQDIIK